jgi:Tfp pilus assembly protein PilO
MIKNSSRTWIAAASALLALVVVAAWLLLISPLRAEAAQHRAQAAGAQAANDLVLARTAELQRQYAGLPDEQLQLDALRAAMPADADLSSLVRGLQSLADSSGVTLMAITPSTAVVPAAAASTAAATGPGVTVHVPVEVQVVGSFAKAQLFLRGVQTELPRAFLVEQVDVAAEKPKDADAGKPATENGDVTMTVTGSVFVLRAAGDLNSAATSAGAAATGAAATPAPAAAPASATTPTTPAA